MKELLHTEMSIKCLPKRRQDILVAHASQHVEADDGVYNAVLLGSGCQWLNTPLLLEVSCERRRQRL